MTAFEKFKYKSKRIFYKNNYFERLFPSMKEQKPGVDLYAVTTSF
jgi:hypothetical protein